MGSRTFVVKYFIVTQENNFSTRESTIRLLPSQYIAIYWISQHKNKINNSKKIIITQIPIPYSFCQKPKNFTTLPPTKNDPPFSNHQDAYEYLITYYARTVSFAKLLDSQWLFISNYCYDTPYLIIFRIAGSNGFKFCEKLLFGLFNFFGVWQLLIY